MKRNLSKIAIFIVLFLAAGVLPAAAAAGDVDPAFEGRIEKNGSVYIYAMQTDGKAFIWGDYDTFNDTGGKLFRLNTDGSIDGTFTAPALLDAGGATVYPLRIVPQPDGKILVGGAFTTVNGENRNRIARLNADGSLDTSFQIGTGATVSDGESCFMTAVTLQPDGKILIAGLFDKFNGLTRSRMARLNADGSVDTSFFIERGNPTEYGPNGFIYAMAVQPDGKIVVVGSFNDFNDTGRNKFLRLDADGSVDDSFVQTGAFETTVEDVKIQPDGKLLVRGNFAVYIRYAMPNMPLTRVQVARLNADGSLDETFATRFISTGARVEDFALQPDGKLVLGGDFFGYQNVRPYQHLVRINSDGSLDETGAPLGNLKNGTINSVVFQPGGRLLVSGNFTRLYFLEGADFPTRYRNGICRLNADATFDESYAPGTGALKTGFDADTYVRAIRIQPDGKIIIGGQFPLAGAKARRNVARLNANGTLDTAFNELEEFDGAIWSFALLPDNNILVGGNYNRYGGYERSSLTRFLPDGRFDPGFLQNVFQGVPIALEVQPDGKILAAGFLFNNNLERINIFRLNADGTADNTFNVGTGALNPISAMAVQPDGKIIIGGNFTTFNGNPRERIARLNPNGSLDFDFLAGTSANGPVYSIAVQPDGKILIAGSFTSVRGVPRNGIARLETNGALDASFDPGSGFDGMVLAVALQSDGRIVAGGNFGFFNGTPANSVARLNADGTLDTSFNAGAGAPAGSTVYALALQNGRLLAGGNFISFNGQNKRRLVRLDAAAPGRTPFDFDGDGRSDVAVFRNGTWYLLRSGAGFAALDWGLASDQLAPADYDGDGKTDFAVFRPLTAPQNVTDFYILNSSNFTVREYAWGVAGDLPVPSDYDGDGKADIAVWRPGAAGEARAYILNSADSSVRVEAFGQTGDVPAIGDYDGDGRSDVAVYRDAAAGEQSYFYYRGSFDNPNRNVTYLPWGTAGDRPVAADYDGDGRTDAAVYRDGTWYVRKSADGSPLIGRWGLPADTPVPADYDGDGRADFTVYRGGLWCIAQTSNGRARYENFGLADDEPIPAVYLR